MADGEVQSPIASSDVIVDVYALPTGKLYLPDRWLFEDGDSDMEHVRQFSPDFSFLISHPSGKKVLFDLGLRKDLDKNPFVIRLDYKYISPVVPYDAFDLLSQGPVPPSSITAIVLSHLHFDHTGDPTRFPDIAELIVGPGGHDAASPGWPVAERSPFASAPLQHPRFRELSFEVDTWEPFGPFPRTYDYFGDGSFLLVDAPGHMPGHLGGLARTATDEWVFMGGDCCHHRSLLVGKRPMSVTVGPGIAPSFHADPPTAATTIDKIRQLEKRGDVFVALAHDARLEGKMPEYPDKVNGWRQSRWKSELDVEIARDYA